MLPSKVELMGTRKRSACTQLFPKPGSAMAWSGPSAARVPLAALPWKAQEAFARHAASWLDVSCFSGDCDGLASSGAWL